MSNRTEAAAGVKAIAEILKAQTEELRTMRITTPLISLEMMAETEASASLEKATSILESMADSLSRLPDPAR
jgi:hypothetical protein